MVKLEITKIDGYIYQLLDQNKNKHSLNLEFIGIKEDIKVGDFINISDELLNQEYSGYSTNYTFGELKSKYGKNSIALNPTDVIMIETNGRKFYCKRLYG